MNVTNITKNIYLSDAIDNYNELNQYSIKAVINTQSEKHDDISELTKRNIAYYWIPIGDSLGPRTSQAINCMSLFSDIKGNILIHCAEGRGRSVFMVICYLIKFEGYSIENAIEYIKSKRPLILMTDSQYERLKIISEKL